jgi:ABC-2 type transport system permease protein
VWIFSQMNVSATICVFAFSVFELRGVRSAVSSCHPVAKKGDPFTWILGGMATMLGGAYFPVEVLPGWLQKFSFLIPITYSLHAPRLTMLKGYSVDMVALSLLTSGVMSAVLLPVSLAIFAAMVRKGRKQGALMQY